MLHYAVEHSVFLKGEAASFTRAVCTLRAAFGWPVLLGACGASASTGWTAAVGAVAAFSAHQGDIRGGVRVIYTHPPLHPEEVPA
jgi:hypothetical protein